MQFCCRSWTTRARRTWCAKNVKDGDEDDGFRARRAPAEPQPVIRDPALARAVDLLKALAVVAAGARLISD